MELFQGSIPGLVWQPCSSEWIEETLIRLREIDKEVAEHERAIQAILAETRNRRARGR